MALFDIGKDYFDTEPAAALEKVFGISGQQNMNYADWLRSRLNPYQAEWKSTLPDQPNLGFYDFLQGKNPLSQFANMAPRQRGEFPGVYSPRVTWRNRG